MNRSTNQVMRYLSPREVVQIGHLVLWSQSPRDAWITVDKGSPYVGLPVETLRHRHGQPALRFGILSPEHTSLSQLLGMAFDHMQTKSDTHSSRACYDDAAYWANTPNAREVATRCALRSLAHSIGILHADYAKAFALAGMSGPVRLIA